MKKTKTTTKRCSRCGRELPTAQFNRRASAPDGLRSTCRECEARRRLANELAGTLGEIAAEVDRRRRARLFRFTPMEELRIRLARSSAARFMAAYGKGSSPQSPLPRLIAPGSVKWYTIDEPQKTEQT